MNTGLQTLDHRVGAAAQSFQVFWRAAPVLLCVSTSSLRYLITSVYTLSGLWRLINLRCPPVCVQKERGESGCYLVVSLLVRCYYMFVGLVRDTGTVTALGPPTCNTSPNRDTFRRNGLRPGDVLEARCHPYEANVDGLEEA